MIHESFTRNISNRNRTTHLVQPLLVFHVVAVLLCSSATSDSIADTISRYWFPPSSHTLTTTLYTPVSPPRDPLTTLSVGDGSTIRNATLRLTASTAFELIRYTAIDVISTTAEFVN